MLVIVDFYFDIGVSKGSSPCLSLWRNGQLIQAPRYFTQGAHCVTVQVELPCELQWRITDRGLNDTEIDDQGCILTNRYACLKQVSIDGIMTDAYHLNNANNFRYIDDDNQEQSGVFFWDKNGLVTWSILHDDPVVWWLDNQALWGYTA